MKRFFKIFWIVLLVAVFLGTMVFLFMKSRPKTVEYEIVSPSTRDLVNSIIATGKVEPGNEVLIKPQISGIIDAIHCKPGEDIKEGDIIATIKVVPEMSSLNSAEGRLRVAGINLNKAVKDFERSKELHDKGIISDEEFGLLLRKWIESQSLAIDLFVLDHSDTLHHRIQKLEYYLGISSFNEKEIIPLVMNHINDNSDRFLSYRQALSVFYNSFESSSLVLGSVFPH